MTHLRKMMLDELQRRNYAQNTCWKLVLTFEPFKFSWDTRNLRTLPFTRISLAVICRRLVARLEPSSYPSPMKSSVRESESGNEPATS